MDTVRSEKTWSKPVIERVGTIAAVAGTSSPNPQTNGAKAGGQVS